MLSSTIKDIINESSESNDDNTPIMILPLIDSRPLQIQKANNNSV